MKRVEIIASGDVQKVGFRDVVQKIGRNLDICGTVENREPYDVRIVAEGEEDALKEFIEALKIMEGPIQVRELLVSWAEATSEFPYFKILRGDWQEELGERFDVAVGLLHRSIEVGEETLEVTKENLAVTKENLAVTRENLAVSKENLEVTRENLAVTKENLAVTKEKLAVTKENLAVRKENLEVNREGLSVGRSMLKKQDETIEEIRGIRSDLQEYMDRRFGQIEGEIVEIKRAIKELGG